MTEGKPAERTDPQETQGLAQLPAILNTCFFPMFQLTAGTSQRGHLLVRPSVLNILQTLPGIFRPRVACGSMRIVIKSCYYVYVIMLRNTLLHGQQKQHVIC